MRWRKVVTQEPNQGFEPFVTPLSRMRHVKSQRQTLGLAAGLNLVQAASVGLHDRLGRHLVFNRN